MWWTWILAWLILVIGAAISLFLVLKTAWVSFALFTSAAADAAETGSALAEKIGEAIDIARGTAEESSGGIADPVLARQRVIELQAERKARREARHEKHLAHGRTWHLDTWLADRQASAAPDA